MLHTQYVVQCDICGHKTMLGVSSLSSQRKRMQDCGWLVIEEASSEGNQIHLCGKCYESIPAATFVDKIYSLNIVGNSGTSFPWRLYPPSKDLPEDDG